MKQPSKAELRQEIEILTITIAQFEDVIANLKKEAYYREKLIRSLRLDVIKEQESRLKVFDIAVKVSTDRLRDIEDRNRESDTSNSNSNSDSDSDPFRFAYDDENSKLPSDEEPDFSSSSSSSSDSDSDSDSSSASESE